MSQSWSSSNDNGVDGYFHLSRHDKAEVSHVGDQQMATANVLTKIKRDM